MGDFVEPPNDWTGENERNMRDALTKGRSFSADELQMARFIVQMNKGNLTIDQYDNLKKAVDERPTELRLDERIKLLGLIENRPDVPEEYSYRAMYHPEPPESWSVEEEKNMREALLTNSALTGREQQMARFVAMAYNGGLTIEQHLNLLEAVNKRPMNLTAEEGQLLRTQMVNRPDAPEIPPKELKGDEIPRWTELASAGSEFKYEPIAAYFNETGSQTVAQPVAGQQLDSPFVPVVKGMMATS